MTSRFGAFRTVGLVYGVGGFAIAGTGWGAWNLFHYAQDDIPLAYRCGKTFYPTSLTLLDKHQETSQMVRLKFKLPNVGDYIGEDAAVSSVVLGMSGLESSMYRAYTPISDLRQRGEIEFLVRAYPNGRLCMMLAKLKRGDTIEMRSFIREFKYVPNQHANVGMIAAGSGITPMYQLLNMALRDPNDKTKFSLLYSNQSLDLVPLRKELEEMQRMYPDRFKLHYSFMQIPSRSFPCHQGFILEDTIKATMPPPSDDTQLLICGSNDMLAFLTGRTYSVFRVLRGIYPHEYFQGRYSGILKDMGYEKKKVYKFGSTEKLQVALV